MTSATTTGLVTKGCYAAELHDCDGGALSREHWISDVLLDRLQADGTGLRVDGLAARGGPVDLPRSAMASRVLCVRHNTMLSPLDTAIAILHDAWLAVATGHTVSASIDGTQLERWAAKVLAGIATSGAVMVDGQRVMRQPPARAILDLLFGDRLLPAPLGFYFAPHNDRSDGLKLKVLCPSPGHPKEGIALGLLMQFVGFRFVLWLDPHPPRFAWAETLSDTPQLLELFYRPAGFDFTTKGRIRLEWDGGPGGPEIPLNLTMTLTPAQP